MTNNNVNTSYLLKALANIFIFVCIRNRSPLRYRKNILPKKMMNYFSSIVVSLEKRTELKRGNERWNVIDNYK